MLILFCFVESVCLLIQLVFRPVPSFNLFCSDRRGCSDCTFLLKLSNKLLSPLLGHVLLGLLHVVAMSVGEVVEAESLVILPLHLVVHLLLCDTGLDVLTILFLKADFLLNLNVIELFNLVFDTLVFKALIFNVLHALLCLVQSVSLGLLNVLFHVLSSVLTRRFVREKSPLATLHLLLQELLKSDLW